MCRVFLLALWLRHCFCLVLPLPSWPRHCLSPVCFTAFVAETLLSIVCFTAFVAKTLLFPCSAAARSPGGGGQPVKEQPSSFAAFHCVSTALRCLSVTFDCLPVHSNVSKAVHGCLQFGGLGGR